MSTQELKDDTGTVEITLNDLEVVSLRISNMWRQSFDASGLAATISTLIRDALPAPDHAQSREIPRLRNVSLPLSAVESYLSGMRQGREATKRYIARLRAGEVDHRREQLLTDADNRVEVSVVAGRFRALAINPEWAECAPIQQMSDHIKDVLPKPLVSEPDEDPDMAKAQKHYTAARRYLIEK